MRVYIPATIPILRQLVDEQQLFPLGGTAFAVTPALREAYAAGDDDELAEVAMQEAARASMRLIGAERDGLDDLGDSEGAAADPVSPVYRRAVIAADVPGATLRPDLDDAVVKLSGPLTFKQVAAVHVDLADAEPQVAKAVDVIDAADLGDTDAEFVLGDAEDHQLAWYAPQEVPFLLELL
ncbi:DUF6912 family protein [Nocardia sp. FBN12]|uniref:DUF6912 family protein n=1 Tax=Nocardia sp. FBN12 TaxID=3419766 RepID=UPI003D07D7ED